MFKTVK